ncbi:MAG: leucyl/phenylalanyl-tRNA--protein transferase [Flavobacteriaceae bacterium]
MIWLSEKIEFPPYELATKEGILALGGDLSPERLLYAYHHGVFPWYSEGDPIVWYAPPKRMVLFPEELKISKSMKQVLRKGDFIITENQAFEQVISYCKNIDRRDGFGTWITDEMLQAYLKLHELGYAKSIEVWRYNSHQQKEELIGGLYGIKIGSVFCGESMFSKVSNTSKIAFVHLVMTKNYRLIDCQIHNSHLESLGAREIKREEFLKFLK